MTNNVVTGVKKSSFNATTTIDGSATLDFVVNGQNLKITYADFLNAIGATGSIVQEGNPAGVPVLDIQGTVNAIRNLVPGQGINANIDVQNSIELSTNFTFDNTGETLVDDVFASQLAWRSISAGAGINVASANGTITVSNTGALVVAPENRVVINSEADFPDAVSGRIPLTPGKEYFIGANVIVTNPFSVSGPTVINSIQYAASLTYLGGGNLFEGTDTGNFAIRNTLVVAPNATMLSFTNTAPASLINIEAVQGLVSKVAEVSNVLALTADFCAFQGLSAGYEATGTIMPIMSLVRQNLISADPAFVGVDLGTNVFSTLEIQNVICNAPGGFGISGLANNGNMVTGTVARVTSCEFVGGVVALQNITSDDIRYFFTQNSGIDDTIKVSFVTMNGNGTDTIISGSGTPVKVTGTFIEQLSSFFTTDATGRIVYVGESMICVSVDIVIAAGIFNAVDDCTVFLAKGNVDTQPVPTVILDSGQVQELAANDPRTMTTMWELPLVFNDFLEIWIQNDDTADNILVTDAKFRVKL